MKFLLEKYSEATELEEFIDSLEVYNHYYKVTLALGDKVQNNYFKLYSKAEEAYDNLLKDIEADDYYYEGAEVTLSEVQVNKKEKQLRSTDDVEKEVDVDLDIPDDYEDIE